MSAMRDPEDLLRDVITGDRAESDPELQGVLRDHPELRARLRRLRGLAAQLDAAGALQRDVLGAPGTPASASLPAIDIGAAQRRLRRRTRRGWLAAAVTLVGLGALAWWTMRADDAPLPQPDPTLGAGDPWVLAVDSAPAVCLHWDDPETLAPGQHYEVRVFAQPSDVVPAATFAAGKHTTWTPTPTELQAMPDPFCYDVDVVGLGGSVRRSHLSAPVRR